jgi:hypothetical protein
MATEPIAPKSNWASDLKSRMGVLGELFGFLWKVKLWWLIPMIVMLFLFAVIFIFGASSPLAPFIYSLR